MKKLIKTLIHIVIGCLVLLGCSKKNDTQPVTVTTWTLGGNTYKGSYTTFVQAELLSTDNDLITLPRIYILFSSEAPAAGKLYSS
jgi:hypothetical protein